MTAVVTPAQQRRTEPHPHQAGRPHRSRTTQPRDVERTLEVEVVAGGDPVRLARILVTMVNNSPMALTEVRVGDRSAYPVPDRTSVTDRGPLHLTLHLRDRSRRLDALVVEEVLALVSTMCRVVQVRRA